MCFVNILYYLFTRWVLSGSDVHLPLFQPPQLKLALLAQWVSLLPVLERRDSSCQVCHTSKTASSKECTVQIYYSIKIMVLLEYLLSLDMGGDRSFPYTVWWYLLTYLTKPMHLSLCHKYIFFIARGRHCCLFFFISLRCKHGILTCCFQAFTFPH